jgi:hypothetical protein
MAAAAAPSNLRALQAQVEDLRARVQKMHGQKAQTSNRGEAAPCAPWR